MPLLGNRRRERRRDQLDKWKSEKVYPYEGEAASEAEKAERAVFDVVAGTLAPQITSKGPDSTRVTSSLLQTALRQDPKKLVTMFT